MTATELLTCTLWWKGPEYLKLNQDQWPEALKFAKVPFGPVELEEMKKEERSRVTNWMLLAKGKPLGQLDGFIRATYERRKREDLFATVSHLASFMMVAKKWMAKVRDPQVLIGDKHSFQNFHCQYIPGCNCKWNFHPNLYRLHFHDRDLLLHIHCHLYRDFHSQCILGCIGN